MPYHEATTTEINDQEEMHKAILLLMNLDMGRYKKLSTNLQDGTYLSRDEYPTTIASMYELMIKHSRSISNAPIGRQEREITRKSGVALTQSCHRNNENEENKDGTELVPGTDDRVFEID